MHACVESLLSMGDDAEFKLLLAATPTDADAITANTPIHSATHSSVSIHDSTSTTPRLEGLFIQRGEAVVFHIHFYLLPPSSSSAHSSAKPQPLDKTGIVIECQRRSGDAFLFQFFLQHLLTLLRQHVDVHPYFEFAANSINPSASSSSSSSSSAAASPGGGRGGPTITSPSSSSSTPRACGRGGPIETWATNELEPVGRGGGGPSEGVGLEDDLGVGRRESGRALEEEEREDWVSALAAEVGGAFRIVVLWICSRGV